MQLQPVHKKANRWIWTGIAAITAIDAVLLLQSGMQVIIPNTASVYGMAVWLALLCFGINFLQPRIRQHASALEALWLLANFGCQMTAAGVVIAVLSYLTARLGMPLQDEILIAIDHFFGFDWLSYVRFVDASLTLSWLANFSYYSLDAQMLLFFILLPLYRQFIPAQHFMISLIFTAVATVVIAALIPALCGYVYYDIDVAREFLNIDARGGVVHRDIMYGLRSHSMSTLAFPLYGIVTFPSFHTALAVLFAYTSLSLRLMRWVLVPLNIMMVLSTPVAGGHYLVDVMAGVVIGILGIIAARRVLPAGIA